MWRWMTMDPQYHTRAWPWKQEWPDLQNMSNQSWTHYHTKSHTCQNDTYSSRVVLERLLMKSSRLTETNCDIASNHKQCRPWKTIHLNHNKQTTKSSSCTEQEILDVAPSKRWTGQIQKQMIHKMQPKTHCKSSRQQVAMIKSIKHGKDQIYQSDTQIKQANNVAYNRKSTLPVPP